MNINFIFYNIIRIINFFSVRLKIRIFNKLFNTLNNVDRDYFFTYNYRKKFFKQKKINKQKNKNKTSIIIQGPILRKNNFTLNTINLYLQNCSSQIILSTWEKELNKDEERSLKKRGVKIVINKIPNYK